MTIAIKQVPALTSRPCRHCGGNNLILELRDKEEGWVLDCLQCGYIEYLGKKL